MATKLRDLIRSVRACKTAAEERALISREKALIRNSFTEDEAEYRARNIAKLLYINMLGHDTDFGQMECLKLITSSSYSDKKIGYLGLTQLFTEKSEVLMMATNRIRLDLQNNTHFTVALALAALSEIANTDMCRELAPEVAKLMTGAPNYIKKKSSLAAVRIIRKAPEAIDEFIDKIQGLMEERHHGVMLSTLALVEEILEINMTYKTSIKKHIPLMVRVLKSLASSYTAEYDISGIIDPFLQIKILSVFRLMGTGDEAISEEISEILAQVATNTPSNKNTGNAVLFECVKTIMSIESSNTLKTVAVNILGKFLSNKDNNSKYVSLQALQKVVKYDINAVQKHKQIILDCLKENDISVKKLALELLSHITNETNILSIVKEMLNYLLVSETEFLQELTVKICTAVEKYAPNRRWHIDTIIRVLTLAGNHVKDESIYSLLHLIAATPELQVYCIHKIYFSLRENINQDGLAKVGLWCIGELGNHLISGKAVGPDSTPIQVSEEEVLELIERILDRINLSESIRQFALTCLVKLYAKFTRSRPKIKQLIDSQTASTFLEVQQRACEFLQLLESDWDNLRGGILDTMPLCTNAATAFKDKPVGDDKTYEYPPSAVRSNATTAVNVSTANTSTTSNGQSTNLIDLDFPTTQPTKTETTETRPNTGGIDASLFEVFGGSTTTTTKPAENKGSLDLLNLYSQPTPQTNLQNTIMFPTNSLPMGGMGGNLLGNTMGTGNNYGLTGFNLNPTPQPTPQTTSSNNLLGGLDLIGFGTPTTTTSSPAGNNALTITAFSDSNIEILFNCTKESPDTTLINTVFNNKASGQITDLVFQAAVLKHLKLTMNPITSNKIPPNSKGAVTQSMKIVNSMQGQKGIVMKLRIIYNLNGQNVTKDATVNDFPVTY